MISWPQPRTGPNDDRWWLNRWSLHPGDCLGQAIDDDDDDDDEDDDDDDDRELRTRRKIDL